MDYNANLPLFQVPPRRFIDRCLNLALRLASFSPAIEVRVLALVFARERRKRGLG
jgi:hypothetical protein